MKLKEELKDEIKFDDEASLMSLRLKVSFVWYFGLNLRFKHGISKVNCKGFTSWSHMKEQ